MPIFQSQYFSVQQAQYLVPGYLIVEAKQDVSDLADLSSEERTHLMHCLTKAEAWIKKNIQPQRIYILKFAEVNTRLHFHLIPRTEHIAGIYTQATQQKAPYNGAQLTAWIWNNHQSLGFNKSDIDNVYKDE